MHKNENPQRYFQNIRLWRLGMKATRKQAQAGAANLARYKAEHPGDANRRHGINSFLSGNYTPKWLAEQLNEFQQGVISDLGGDPTMAQRTIVATCRRSLGVVILGWDWIEKHGVVTADGDGAAILPVLASNMNSLRLGLCALGLQRRPKKVDALQDIIAEHSK